MKTQFCLSFSIILLLLSCANNPKTYKKFTPKKHKTYKEIAYKKEKFSERLSPVESMAVGAEKQLNLTPLKSYDPDSDKKEGAAYVGQYKVGQPYEIEGVFYYPQEYDEYEEVGVASWYGDDFHGRSTANGEVYDLNGLTAAHQTLPLPSLVRVTNLQNGHEVVVRVNDRGPFARSRIIDLSEKAAEKLGYRDRGTTTVKVEYLPKETDALLKSLNLK